MSALLKFEGFSYRHAGANAPALRDLDLTIDEGGFVLLAGPSGSGKSTLLRAACGLAPNFDGGTAAGTVTVGGFESREHGPGEIARVCGTVLQDPERQVVMKTVRAELALPLESRGFAEPAIARAVEETSLLLGLADLLDRSLSTLSGGELQRVAIGAALAPRPGLLLLDEPTSQLDPVAADDLAWLLRRLNEEQGIAVLVSEQRLERLLPAADRVVVLNEGRIACDSTPTGFLEWAAGRAPALQTPGGALFALAGLPAPPTTVKQARVALSEKGLLPKGEPPRIDPPAPRTRFVRRRSTAAVAIRSLWDERTGSRALLAGVDLSVEPGETVALMGRNGAGKSTLLKHVAGLLKPTRGRIDCAGRVALLMQNPADYLIGERVADLIPIETLERAGIAVPADRHPRDLSGGERQRIAFEMVIAGEPAAAVLLDEPTRGLDRARRNELAERVRSVASEGAAVVVATHDAELAAELADRVVLLGEGRVLAEGSPRSILSGGWYFATETARILDGAGGALLPSEGAGLLTGERARAGR
ncbi:MAG: ATP-binding cassette domain-containing protein [Actinomycetes bacterium]